MLKRKIGITLFILLSFFPLLKINAESSNNVGFVSGNIWYSEDPFQEGDKIKIHTLVYNSDSRELSGTVFFFDKTLFLGNRSLSVAPRSSADISIDWTVTAGDHTIFAQIQNAKFLLANGKYETAVLNEVKSDESKRTIAKTIEKETSPSTANLKTTNNLGADSVIKLIKDNTPSVVSKTIDGTVNVLEGIRDNINTSSNSNKETVKKELKTLETGGISVENKDPKKAKVVTENKKTEKVSTNTNILSKPFMYVKLFFLTLVSFIFGSKLIFYSLLVLSIFFILRFCWRLIF